MRLGVCYYPEQWPREAWAEDARRMAELGLRVVRIAEFAWAKLEPRPGVFEWGWLDEAIDTLHAAGLEVVLGTPTAAPPHWLVQQHPEVLPVDATGRTKAFGSRRHYCFSSEPFHAASRRIVEAMARRYGKHPAVVAWQTDNEYGCHDTTLSYSASALRGFRRWLAERYGSIDALNRAWGNVFWSMEYPGFDAIGFPTDLPAQANPIHALDFRRFASDEVRRFNRLQVELLRKHAPGRPVLHNFMGFFGDFEHHEVACDLDIAAWDSYPLGATETARFVPDDERVRWMRSGHPDVAAFHHDLYRGLCNGRLWVMEQQAGPVNWAAWNPAPLPGMVRTWTWEAFAHGAELVSYFRWRQAPFAQEQMHSGLNTSDHRLDLGGAEAQQVADELSRVPAQAMHKAPVALVFDYATRWVTQIQPHGADFDYFALVFAWYTALRRLGLDVDIVPASADFSGRSLVVVPTLATATADFAQRLHASGAHVVLGPRSGSKSADFALPDMLPPGPLAALLPMRVTRVESLRPGAAEAVLVGEQVVGHATRWRDLVEPAPAATVDTRFADGHPARLRHGRTSYFAGWLDDALLRHWLREEAQAAGLTTHELPEGLRLRRRGNVQFAIHYGPGESDVPAPAGANFLLGGPRLRAAEVAAWSIE